MSLTRYFVLFLLCLAPALSQAFEPNDYQQLSQQAFREWEKSAQYIAKFNEFPPENRFEGLAALDKAIVSCQQAINYFDQILHALKGNGTFSKSKPWKTQAQKECKASRAACVNRLNDLTAVSNRIKWDHALQQIESDKMGRMEKSIAIANKKFKQAEELTGKEKINCLKEVADAIRTAVSFCEQLLKETKNIGDEAYRVSLDNFRKQIQNLINSHRQSITDVETLITQLEYESKYSKLNQHLKNKEMESTKQMEYWVAIANQKIEQASTLTGKPRTDLLKEVVQAIQNAIAEYELLLQETHQIGDATYQASLQDFQKQVQKVIDNHKQVMQSIEREIR